MSDDRSLVDVSASPTGRTAGPALPPPKPVDFGDSIGAGWRSAWAGPDAGQNQQVYEDQLVAEIEKAALARGFKFPQARPIDARDVAGMSSVGAGGILIGPRKPKYDRAQLLIDWLVAQRAAGHDPLPKLPRIGGKQDIADVALERRRRDLAAADADLARGNPLGGFIGSFGRGFFDPSSYIPVGGPARMGATSLARTILAYGRREALANVALAGLQEGGVQGDAAALGVDRGPGDVAADLGMQGLVGGVIGGAGGFVHHLVSPPAHGPDDIAAARAVVDRDNEIAAGSPYVDSPAGDARFRGDLNAVEQWLRSADGQAPPPDPAVQPGPAPRHAGDDVPRETLWIGAYVSRPPAVGGPEARRSLKQRIHRVEAGGTDDYNELSGAMGPYQFLASTWTALYKRRFGAGGLSDAEIAAKRRDPALNERLMDDLIDENARALHRAGLPETAGNLYLAHFAGADRAARILNADPDTPVARLFSKAAMDANPMLRDMTASDLIEWAHRKMGEAVIGGTDRPRVNPDLSADEDAIRAAQAQLDAAEMDLAMQRRADAGDGGAAFGADDLLPWLDENASGTGVGDGAMGGDRQFDPAPQRDRIDVPRETSGDVSRSAAMAAPPPPSITAPESRRIDALADRVLELEKAGKSLAPARIAKALAVDEATAQRALMKAAGMPGSGLRFTRNGRVQRKPRELTPPDAMAYLASHGGIRDDENHDLAGLYGRPITSRGPLLRPGGMSIDEAGALLNEGKYLLGDDWTEQDVLGLIDRHVKEGKRSYAMDRDLSAVIDRQARMEEAERAAADREFAWDALSRVGLNAAAIDDALVRDTAGLIAQGMSPEDAAAAAIQHRQLQTLDLLHELSGDSVYDFRAKIEDAGADPFGDPDWLAGGDDRPEAGAGAEGNGAEGTDADAPTLQDLETIWNNPGLLESVARDFDDPFGVGAVNQAESIEHDLRAATDPGDRSTGQMGAAADPGDARPLTDRQRQEAVLKAAAPLQAGVDQDGTMGLGLFDAADQQRFDLGDEGTRTAREIIDDIDRDQSELDAIDACMKPKAPDGEGGAA